MLGAPTAVAVCVPGKHDLIWNAHAGSLSIPIAVAFAELPMRLTSKATYSTATKTLTVSGKLLAENKPAAGRAVWVSTQYPSVLGDRTLGTAVTRSDGTYVLTTKTTEPPPAVETFVFNVYGAGCHAKSSAPGGCKSESLDTIQNNGIEVARRGRARA